jgi:hypothetical protein
MNQEELMQRLREPFPFAEVEAKIQVTNADKTKGMAVFYIDSRAIQRRLDEVFGPFGWKNHFYSWQNQAQVCGISVYDAERSVWVEKQDGAPNTDIEPIMGGLSHSFKRAACVWGIGRYLYQIGGVWCEIELKGKSTVIKQGESSKLENAYNAAVKQIFGIAANSSLPAEIKAAPHEVINSPPVTSTSGYTVKSITPSGQNSVLLEMVDGTGEVISAYVRSSDKSIAAGSLLKNVTVERKNNSYGGYNLLTDYQVAA